MSKAFEKFKKKLFRVVGWIFQDFVDKKLGWIHYILIIIVSAVVFWFFGFYAVIKVYAVILWIIALGMIIFQFVDKARSGKSNMVKFINSKTAGLKKSEESELFDQKKPGEAKEKKNPVEPKKVEPIGQKPEASNKDDLISNLPGIKGSDDDEPMY